jgi:hypothetical protein
MLPLAQEADQLLQPLDISERPEGKGMILHARYSETVGATARGHHTPTEGQPAPLRGGEAAGCGVDRDDTISQPGDTAAGEETVVTGCDFPAAEFVRQEFVEEWKEQEPFVGLDQQDGWMAAAFCQRQCGVETSESTSGDNDRSRTRRTCPPPWGPSVCGGRPRAGLRHAVWDRGWWRCSSEP